MDFYYYNIDFLIFLFVFNDFWEFKKTKLESPQFDNNLEEMNEIPVVSQWQSKAAARYPTCLTVIIWYQKEGGFCLLLAVKLGAAVISWGLKEVLGFQSLVFASEQSEKVWGKKSY